MAEAGRLGELMGVLAAGTDLSREQTRTLFTEIMSGEATPAQIGGVLMALRVKGESADELAGAVEAMRALSTRVPAEAEHLVDTCGTGGSGANKLFNVSTAAAFVAAAAGARVAKHGNRGLTSASGSADVLHAAGIEVTLTPEQIAECIREVGVGFMFAPAHHSAIRHAVGPRRELGVHTLFNMIAPLTNPAGAPNQVIGVAFAEWAPRLAEVLRRLGSGHVLLVHADGLDELSIAGPSQVVELAEGEITRYEVTPEQLGLERHPLEGLRADSPEASLALIRESLTDSTSPAGAIVALNAGAAIRAAGIRERLADGVTLAREVIDRGRAAERLAELARRSKEMVEA